jgi:hypothetical protein
MALEETEPRRNVFTVAREGRLSRDSDGVYWLASDEGGAPAAASATFTTAVGELVADGDLADGATDEDTGITQIEMTPAGQALSDAWAASLR